MLFALPQKSFATLIRKANKKSPVRMIQSSASGRSRGWPFAPLGRATGEGTEKLKLHGIVFDVDGTLCEPQNYMFAEMRAALGIPKSIDILDHLHSLPADEQEIAHEKIRVIERRAMRVQKPQSGLQQLMDYLDAKQIPKAICTRNFNEPVNHLLTTFLPKTQFSPIITRDFKPPKPDPAGILHIAQEWGNEPDKRATNMIMVGDSIDDMLAGSRAGAITVLLAQDQANLHVRDHEATDFHVARLDEIIAVLEAGILEQQ